MPGHVVWSYNQHISAFAIARLPPYDYTFWLDRDCCCSDLCIHNHSCRAVSERVMLRAFPCQRACVHVVFVDLALPMAAALQALDVIME